METLKVNNNNNFKLFAFRYFATISLCFLTLLVTGRIADMDVLVGFLQYNAYGTSTSIARYIFSNFGFFGNKYIIIAVITAICSIILFLILNKFIDKNNIKLWRFFLFSPGLLIYSNTATKETLFLYPAIIYIILEIFFLTGKNSRTNLLYFITKTALLFILFLIRGDLMTPYLGLFFLSIFFKTFYLGETSHKINLNQLIIKSFLISILIIYVFSISFPQYFFNTINYLSLGFEGGNNLLRPTIDIAFIKNPITNIQMQYLSLFPTPLELLNKPYKLIIVIDSLLLVYVFINSWRKLFKLSNSYKRFKKIILILFTYTTVLYFTIFGLIGSFNLGSSQRLRINFFPIAIIFPLILEKQIREKQRKKQSYS